jgi:acyl-CoA synthetase (AMP-forming)/AMP-acid ligase II
VATLFAERAAAMRDAVAIVDRHRGQDRTTTFQDLEDRGARIAALLRRIGLGRGDVVLLGHPPDVELYATVLAILRIGAVAMIVEPGLGRRGLSEACEMASPKAVFAPAGILALALTIPAVRRIRHRLTSSRRFPTATSLHAARSLSPDSSVACFAADAPAILTFTSGSTGAPKGAVRTHSLLEAQYDALRSVAANEGDVDLVSLPVVVLANLAAGATSVLADIDQRRLLTADLAGVRGQIARLAPTRITVSPVLVERLASEGGVLALGRLRRVVTGGGPLFPDIAALVGTVAPGVDLISVYGSTEAEPIAHVRATATNEDDRRRMQSGGGLLAGTPVPEVALRIVRISDDPAPETLAPDELSSLTMGPGEPGEIIVAGAHVVAGYLHGRGDRETKIRAGGTVWHRTGDAGYLDRHGRLWLLGRVSATVRDERGTAYPFAVECAARSIIGPRRMALAAVAGCRTLVVEGRLSREEGTALRRGLEWASLDDVVRVARLPMDGRHASKVNYPALEALLVGRRKARLAFHDDGER